MMGWIAFGVVAVLGAAPIVAVCIGARAFDQESKPERKTCSDDTMEIPTVRVKPKLYMR